MNRHWRVLLAFTIILGMCPISWANDFGARRYLFTPHLIENHNPALCNAFVAQVKEEFFSTKANLTVTNIKGAQWLDWQPVKPESANEPLDLWRLDLDLDGSGKKRTLVLLKSTQRYGSGEVEQRDAYFFASAEAFDKWFDKLDTSETPFAGIKQYFPSEVIKSLTPAYELYSGGEHRWFTFQGKHFFLTSEEIGAGFAGVAYLAGDGTRKVACVLQDSPPRETVTAFEGLPGIKSYLKRLWTIGHASGGPCGTLHSEDRHDMQAQQAISRAAIRPWATSNKVGDNISRTYYYVYDERILKFIEDWGYQDTWSYREYQTYLNHIQPAIKALENYYRKAFDVSVKTVRQRAKTVFEQLTAAHLLIPQSYEPGHHPFFRSPEESEIHRSFLKGDSHVLLVLRDELEMSVSDPETTLGQSESGKRALDGLKEYAATREKLLSSDKQDLKTLEKQLKEQESGLTEAKRRERQSHLSALMQDYETRAQELDQNLDAMEKELVDDYVKKRREKVSNAGPYLLDSVEHPHLLQRLLDAGADVNTKNAWDKTALMIAAHMDRPDSVRLLLKAGADPNLQTRTMSQCGFVIRRGNRTALMYAAENAALDVMRVLVEAGAKTDIADSEGNTLSFYLAMNPFLSETERKLSVSQLLTPKVERPTRASFDCTLAKRWDEKLVCKDPVLVRQDQQMASAFAAWKRTTHLPREARGDQVRWIKRRAEQCRPFEEEDLAIGCLQLETRARIRYLHSRLVE